MTTEWHGRQANFFLIHILQNYIIQRAQSTDWYSYIFPLSYSFCLFLPYILPANMFAEMIPVKFFCVNIKLVSF